MCCLVAVAAPLFQLLWVSATTSLRMFAAYRLLLFFVCVFFALFKSSVVPTAAAVAESLPSMQQSVPTERYLDDWRYHLFHHTFTWITQRLRLGALMHPATVRGQQHTIQQLNCPSGLVLQRRNISTVSCSADGNCGWHFLLNGNCRFLGTGVCTTTVHTLRTSLHSH